MSLSVNYLVFCVPALHINNYRNRDIVLNTLITEFITLGVKHHMAGKVPKSKDFYKVSLCSNTIVSTCLENGKTAKVDILDDGEVGFGSTEYIVFRAIEGVSDPDYIYYLVCSPLVRDPAIKSMVGSSGRQRVQTNVLAAA